MANEIAAYRVQFSDREIEEFLGRARSILSSGWLIPGAHNAELEQRFAEFIGVSYATTVASGTAALEIGFRCLGLVDAAVLVPANTNYATAEALLRAGGRPVLYDSDLYADVRSIEAVWTRDIAAVVVVHIGGYLAPCLPVIRRFCDERGLFLIEDASHAHGATLQGKPAGTFGDVAAFSLFATKVVTTSEGGMLVTSDARVAADSVRYRDQGKADDGVHHIVFGSAWRMSELHAALGLVQMDNLESNLARANEIAARYTAGIVHPWVHVPCHPEARCSGHKFVIVTPDNTARESLKTHLLGHGIRYGKGVYDVPLSRQPALRFGVGQRCPKAERFAASHLCLPMWKGLTDAEVDQVIEVVNHWQYGG